MLYKLQVYSIVIRNSFIVIIKQWLCFPCCTICPCSLFFTYKFALLNPNSLMWFSKSCSLLINQASLSLSSWSCSNAPDMPDSFRFLKLGSPPGCITSCSLTILPNSLLPGTWKIFICISWIKIASNWLMNPLIKLVDL